jgi:serine protease Do
MQKYSTLSFKLVLALSAMAFAASSFLSGQQETPPQSSQEQSLEIPVPPYEPINGAVDFRQAAKVAIPAVVSIQVQAKKKPQAYESEDLKNPYDLFSNDEDDFWSLFGFPRRGSSRQTQPVIGQGSGAIVSPDGYILTNSHVVNGMDSILVKLTDGREFSAKVLGEDPKSDLALIKIEANNLPYLQLGNSDELEVGQPVAAIGNPFGLQATLTTGVVSAKGRNTLDIVPYADFIQTDAAINRGNSGGPLITLDAKLIGITTAIATNASSAYMGIGFAIPINMAKRVMDEILLDGKVSHGFLGVSLQSIDYNLAQAFGLKKVEGALVANVSKDSPAEKAGLQVEDIILAYDGKPVDNAATLRNAIYMLKPGNRVMLTVQRKDQIIQLPVILADHSEGASVSTSSQNNQLGIEVENLTPEIARTLGYGHEQGVVITKVNPSSVAGLAGLKKGALILSVNRKKVANVSDYNQALKESPKDKPVLLQIKQGDNYLFVSLQSN